MFKEPVWLDKDNNKVETRCNLELVRQKHMWPKTEIDNANVIESIYIPHPVNETFSANIFVNNKDDRENQTPEYKEQFKNILQGMRDYNDYLSTYPKFRDAKYLGFGEKGFFKVNPEDFESTYEMMRETVGGYIELVPLTVNSNIPSGVDIFCDEEGKIKYLNKQAIPITGYLVRSDSVFVGYACEEPEEPAVLDVLLGNLIFTRTNEEGETVPLTVHDVAMLTNPEIVQVNEINQIIIEA